MNIATKPRPDLDERIDPRFRAFLAPLMSALEFPSSELSVEELKALYTSIEPIMWQGIMKPYLGNVPIGDLQSYSINIPAEGLNFSLQSSELKSHTCIGHADGLKLYINRPATSERVPAIVYFHGGGMVMTKSEHYEQAVGRLLAHQGLCVIMPEFRNSTVAPFPAAMNDCYAALKWVTENKDTLGITSQIIAGGDSSGGSLSISMALLAKDRGLSGLRGIYIMWPGIGGSLESQSWKEFNGYLISKDAVNAAGKLYYLNPADDDKKHLAFPALATAEHLRGLVPTVVVVNELDPIKDDGISFYRTAIAAGVRARLIISGGTIHGGDLGYGVAPDIALARAQAIFNFAKSL